MKTILVPTDLSREADHALEVAISMARQLKASIQLIHVVQSIYDQTYANTANLPLQGREAFEQDLELARQEMADLLTHYSAADVSMKWEVKVGSIFQDIADNIVKIDGDLIVLGTKGDTGVHEFFIGSNAEKVVRRAHCPVITVRKKIKDFKLKQVVLATDFTDKAYRELAILQQWRKISPFDIHLLYVNTPLHFKTTTQIKSRMNAFLENQQEGDFITAIVDEYSLVDGIQTYAGQVGADLIAILTHGREGVEHVLAGSLAEQLVNRATIPVLTFRLHSF